MPEEIAPVLLHVKSGDRHTFVIAKIIRGGDGRLHADPFVVPQETAFAHLGKPELDARFLELLPDGGGGKPIHLYHGIVTIHPPKQT